MAFWCLEFCNGKVVLSTVGVQIPLFPRGRVDERMDAAERGCDVLHQIFRCEIRTNDGENGQLWLMASKSRQCMDCGRADEEMIDDFFEDVWSHEVRSSWKMWRYDDRTAAALSIRLSFRTTHDGDDHLIFATHPIVLPIRCCDSDAKDTWINISRG